MLFALEYGGPGAYSRVLVVKPLLEAGAESCVTDSLYSTALINAVDIATSKWYARCWNTTVRVA